MGVVQEDAPDDDELELEELVLDEDELPEEEPEEDVLDALESLPEDAALVPLSWDDPSPFTSVGFPLFSDLVPGSFNLSE